MLLNYGNIYTHFRINTAYSKCLFLVLSIPDNLFSVYLCIQGLSVNNNLLWIIPLIITIIVVAIFISKRLGKKKPVVRTPIIIKNDRYTISYVDLTHEMLREAQHMYDEDLFKDAHEKLSQAIRFYYSNRFSTGTEITNMDALQLLRKENIPEFDSILDYLGMCEMIEFAKNPTERKKFFSAIKEFSQIIK